MELILNVKKASIALKFDFALMYKVNEKFSNVDENGNALIDGVPMLYGRLDAEDDAALVELIEIATPASVKANTPDILAAIQNYVETLSENAGISVGAAYEQLYENVKNGFRDGFFARKISRYLDQLETAIEKQKALTQTDEVKETIEALEQLQTLLGDAI